MILIPEQVSILREKERLLERKIAKIDEYYASIDNTMEERTLMKRPVDEFSGNDIHLTKKELQEVKEALEKGVYLKKRNLERIDIGTRFLFQFLDEEEVRDFILVDNKIGTSVTDGFVGINSPLGKEFLGKCAKERIENIGTILEIKKSYDDYMHYIREKKHTHRMSKEELRKMKYLRENSANNKEAKEEYQSYQTITKSQRDLLIREQMRLMYGRIDRVTKDRLQVIKKVLEQREIEVPNEDDETIAVGSRFSVQTFTDEGIKTKRVEMINQAVGEELDEYVERTSPMGYKMFGLKDGDEFIYFKGSKYVCGVVFDIDNSKNQIKTNSALTYQKVRNRRK